MCYHRETHFDSHIHSYDVNGYIYMSTRNTELARLLGDQYMKRQYKVIAQESAYVYQKQAWGPLVRILEGEDGFDAKKPSREAARGKMEAFLKCLEVISQKHRSSSNIIPELDLREQIKEATVKLVVPAYAKSVDSYASVLERTSHMAPELLGGMLGQISGGGDSLQVDGVKLKRGGSRDCSGRLGGNPTSPRDRDAKKDHRRSRSNADKL